MIMTKSKTWLACQWSKERCLKKLEQRKASSKDITKYIRTFLKIVSSRERASWYHRDRLKKAVRNVATYFMENIK